jgi:hypothetical protein
MRLARLGAFHQTRLSFLRQLLRRIAREGWQLEPPRRDLDADGFGYAVYTLRRGERPYSLVAFSHDLPAEKRTDRVIAEAWDATFVLYDGRPSAGDIMRLGANVPRQEAGRYRESELVLARANKSVRLFDAVVLALAAGRQPDAGLVESVGYLMRTTAVYGNGKFGIADRELIADREELAGPFQAEMLTVWLIRQFSIDLVEHVAARRAPGAAARLSPELRRRFGIGNATGLGMAPFLVRHQVLIDRWITARETALARVRSLERAAPAASALVRRLIAGQRAEVAGWRTDDPVQAPRIGALASDLKRLDAWLAAGGLEGLRPWDRLYRWAEQELTLEGQELCVTLLLEPHGEIIDDLGDAMSADEAAEFAIDGRMPVNELARLIERDFAWALATDYSAAESSARFWYVSAGKLEPRLGERALEAGAELEMPLAVGRDVGRLHCALSGSPAATIGDLLARHPEHRLAVRRVQIAARHPYGEVRDNLIDGGLRAIDLLRCKLSFFGVTRYDPRSDKWLRITLYQGAPLADEIGGGDFDLWGYGRREARA